MEQMLPTLFPSIPRAEINRRPEEIGANNEEVTRPGD
jgi:hypothetical protein